MRRAVLAGVASLVTSCSGLNGVAPENFDVIFAATYDCGTASVPARNPADFMIIGFTRVRAACEAFFVEAEVAQQQAIYGRRVLSAGLAGTVAAMAATASEAATVKTIGLTTAGVVFAKEAIDAFTATRTFGPGLYKVKHLVDQALDDYEAKNKDTQPANYCRAYHTVAGMARICSLASMRSMLNQQLAIPSAADPPPNEAVVLESRPVAGAAGGADAAAPKTRRVWVRRPISNSTATGYTVRPLQ